MPTTNLDEAPPNGSHVTPPPDTNDAMALVSHELRTPLNAILGWARLLRVGQLDASATTTAVETVERNAKALARIVDDLLDMSRIVGGSVHVGPEPVDLVMVV